MKLYYLLIIILITSCSLPKNESYYDNIIHFEDALRSMEEVKLSVLIDSIDLIPLQTNENCLLRNTYWFTHTPPYICVSGHLFDYDGNFKYKIGVLGGGPCEDFYRPIEILYNPSQNLFLSKGTKLILYDKEGKCTGIEKQLFLTNKDGKIISGNEKLKEKAIAGNNFIFNNNYDSLLWIDRNLHELKQIKISNPGNISLFLDESDRYYRLFTTNRDSTLFYNYWNDTIYRVTSTDIKPKWVINLGQEKAPEELRIHAQKLKEELFLACVRSSRARGNIDWNEIDALRLTKDKKAIWAIYETTNYLFFIWSKISPNNFHRNVSDFYLQIAYYNKKTGETIAVKGPGFTDDILGTGPFNPVYGVFTDNLMKVIWPFELTELIEKKQAKGEEVHPRLLELHKQMSDEDNPFLMVAHLKK